LVRVVEKYTSAILKIEDEIEQAVSDYSLGRTIFTRLVNRAEHAVGFDLGAFEDKSVLLYEDYCYVLTPRRTMEQIVQQDAGLVAFSAKYESEGTPFVFAMPPSKICTEHWLCGTLDFTQQNRALEIPYLREQGVDVLDFTDCLHEAGFSHEELFFPTDHHWTPATGLWAADLIAEYVHEQYGLIMDRSVLEPSQYNTSVYEDVFLGSSGQKVTEEKIAPDDFALYYPKFETDISFRVWEKWDRRGDFSILYDMYYLDVFEPIMESDIYSTYMHSNQALTRITNHRNPDGLRVLMIGDSYDNVVVPFIALAVHETTILDYRSVKLDVLHEEILPQGYDLVISTVNTVNRLQ